MSLFSPDKVEKGEIYIVDLGYENCKKSEMKGRRPCLIVQNDIGNKFSTTTIIAPITNKKPSLPTHMEINLKKESIILFEQLKTISKKRLSSKIIGKLNEEQMKVVDEKIMISFGIRV